MIQFLLLELLGVSQIIPRKIKNVIKIVNKCVKYTNDRTGDVVHWTQYSIKSKINKQKYLGLFAAETHLT